MTHEYAAEQTLALYERRTWDSGRGSVVAEAEEILAHLRRGLERDLETARRSALRLAARLAAAPKPLARGGLAPWQARKIEQILRERLDETILVAEMAQAVRLSVSHFCRAFKETFGETPHGYIMRLRIEHAQSLMRTTEEPLSQIALACGLADQAHLSKLFRRRVGQTPRDWRRLNAQGHDGQAIQELAA